MPDKPTPMYERLWQGKGDGEPEPQQDEATLDVTADDQTPPPPQDTGPLRSLYRHVDLTA